MANLIVVYAASRERPLAWAEARHGVAESQGPERRPAAEGCPSIARAAGELLARGSALEA